MKEIGWQVPELIGDTVLPCVRAYVRMPAHVGGLSVREDGTSPPIDAFWKLDFLRAGFLFFGEK